MFDVEWNLKNFGRQKMENRSCAQKRIAACREEIQGLELPLLAAC